jgi:hypothetical protein
LSSSLLEVVDVGFFLLLLCLGTNSIVASISSSYVVIELALTFLWQVFDPPNFLSPLFPPSSSSLLCLFTLLSLLFLR